TKSAGQGYPLAETALGTAYMGGTWGVSKNGKESLKWLARGANHGDPEAQYWLGTAYEEGRGTKLDLTKASLWFHKSAAQGHLPAVQKLAYLYLHGKGVKQDYPEAYFWCTIALGHQMCPVTDCMAAVTKERDEAAQHLTPAELATVTKRVGSWEAK